VASSMSFPEYLKIKSLLLLSILSITGASAYAQTGGTCSNQPFRQELDFWVGSWNVYSNSGDFLGRHDVTEWETGCLIESKWTGIGGDTGQAMNFYDTNISMWRRIFISPTEIADLRGSLSSGIMTMDGNLFRSETQSFSQRRLQLSRNVDGSISYIVEERSAAQNPWTEVRRMTGRSTSTDPETQTLPAPTLYQPGQPLCWNLPDRSDFAFWAGSWSVGAASNRISTEQSGCLLREQWFGSGADTGVSYNYFDPFAAGWRQVWVSRGVIIDIFGGTTEPSGAMHLVGVSRNTGTTNSIPYRGTWTPINQTTMTQFLERQVNGVWTVAFQGTYIRKFNTFSTSVVFSGLGAGSVTSSPFGLNCTNGIGVCTVPFRIDEPVNFIGNAATGSSFAGWTDGPCFGQTGDCLWNVAASRELEARFTLDSVPEGRIVAAVLPGARSGYVDGPDLTVFTSVVSRPTTPAQSCTIAAPDGAPASLSYRRVDAANSPIGPPNPIFDLTAGDTASFVLILTPDATTPASGETFTPVISCENASLSPVAGVNGLTLSIDTIPVPDILSISATPTNDGVIRIADSGGISFMTAAAVNIGAGDGSAGTREATITVTADDGGADLPLTLQVCETGPQGGCLAPRSNSVMSAFDADPKFFAVFVRGQAGSPVNFNPGGARVFLRFRDSNGVVRSVTSAAVTAPN
jgi:hypothetical protein